MHFNPPEGLTMSPSNSTADLNLRVVTLFVKVNVYGIGR